nr:uncharacterized mitochondrial protein AtMg00810-like [Tanacetum cinerariifolium]
MEIKDKLDLNQNGTSVDATKYRSMIGALMYLTSSRPDIVYATCLCARYQAKPTEKHLKEVKRIFRYLRGTINTGLWYMKDSGFELIGFSDADYAGCKDTFKSTFGGAQFLGEKMSALRRSDIENKQVWIKQWCYNLTPAESKFKTPMLDHQDKYMMKAQQALNRGRNFGLQKKSVRKANVEVQIMKDLKEIFHLIRSFFTELLIIQSRRIRNVRLRLSLRNIGLWNGNRNNQRLDVRAHLESLIESGYLVLEKEHEPEDDDEDPEEDPNKEHEPEDEDTRESSRILIGLNHLRRMRLLSHHHHLDNAPLGHRAAMIRMRDDIPEEDMPPRMRSTFTAPSLRCDIAESSAAATRVPRSQVEGVGYVRALQASEKRMMTSIEEVNLRTDCRNIRLKIDVVRGQRTAYEIELQKVHHAYPSSKAQNRALLARLETLKTHMSHMELQRLSAEDLEVTYMMRIHTLEARARTDTVEDVDSSVSNQNSKFSPFKSLSEYIQESNFTNRWENGPCMRTHSKSYPNNSNAIIPRRSNRKHGPNIVKPEIRTIEEVVPMADRTMEELL